jgi:hypothetical protein
LAPYSCSMRFLTASEGREWLTQRGLPGPEDPLPNWVYTHCMISLLSVTFRPAGGMRRKSLSAALEGGYYKVSFMGISSFEFRDEKAHRCQRLALTEVRIEKSPVEVDPDTDTTLAADAPDWNT